MSRRLPVIAAFVVAACGPVEPPDEVVTPAPDPGLGDLLFTSPSDSATSPITFSVDAPDDVVWVRYVSDAMWTVGDSYDAAAGFPVVGEYGLAGSRHVVATGYDSVDWPAAEGDVRFEVLVSPGGHLGLWLEDLPATGMDAVTLATRLADLGVGRVFVRVADGVQDCDSVPAGCDPALPQALLEAGIEPWAWLRAVPEGAQEQSDILPEIAPLGYVGVVVGVDAQFEGRSEDVRELALQMVIARLACIDLGIHVGEFPILVSAAPELLVEALASTDIDDLVDGWAPRVGTAPGDVTDATCLVREAGSGEPIWPVLAVDGLPASASELDAAIAAAGKDASIAFVPPAADDSSWAVLEGVDWAVTEYAVVCE